MLPIFPSEIRMNLEILVPLRLGQIVVGFLAFVAAAGVAAQTGWKCGPDDKDRLTLEDQKHKADSKKIKIDDCDATVSLITRHSEWTRPLSFYPSRPAKPERVIGQSQTRADDPAALAKKLANPVAALISFPLQHNFDFGMGPDGGGYRYTLNVQPVIPIALSKEWNLISRTIVPIIGQSDVVGTSGQFGLGDTVQAFYFSPNRSEPFIWGLGPQVLIPTATNEFLGSQKLGFGPTGVIIKQHGKWTVGALVGHLWSVAGKSTRANVSSTNIQPVLSYTTKTAWTFGLNTESTYDWSSKTWSAPVHLTATKLVRFGKRPVSVGGGLRCWAASTPTGPTGCGFRLIITPLFPG